MSEHDQAVSPDRRQFLRDTLTLSAGAAVAAGPLAAVAHQSVDHASDHATTAPESRGYHLTDHIAEYYKLAAL